MGRLLFEPLFWVLSTSQALLFAGARAVCGRVDDDAVLL